MVAEQIRNALPRTHTALPFCGPQPLDAPVVRCAHRYLNFLWANTLSSKRRIDPNDNSTYTTNRLYLLHTQVILNAFYSPYFGPPIYSKTVSISYNVRHMADVTVF